MTDIKWLGRFRVLLPSGEWWDGENIIVDEGQDYLLNAGVNSGAASGSWFVVPYINAVSPVETWTAATFETNAQEQQLYTEGARQSWNIASISNGVVTPGASSNFTAPVAGMDVYGFGIMNRQTKGDNAGILLAAADFGSLQNYPDGQQCQITYAPELGN